MLRNGCGSSVMAWMVLAIFVGAAERGISSPTFVESERVWAAVISREISVRLTADDTLQVMFVSLAGKSPSKRFTKGLSNSPRPIRAVSECRIDVSSDVPMSDVRDKRTGKVGMILSLAAVRWTGAKTATVRCTYYAGPLYAGVAFYSLAKKNGRWSVTARDQQWIS